MTTATDVLKELGPDTGALSICAAFARAGVSLPVIHRVEGFSHPGTAVAWAKRNGYWTTSPKRGDIVIHGEDVGIVAVAEESGFLQVALSWEKAWFPTDVGALQTSRLLRPERKRRSKKQRHSTDS